MENINKKRDVNFELMRIVVMFLIIILHSICHSNVLSNSEISTVNFYIVYIIYYASLIGVNCFVMITGYYMIKSKIKIKRLISIELTTIFYGLVIEFIAYIINISKAPVQLKYVFPTITGSYWFISAYMGLSLLIPFINKLLCSLNQKQYKVLLIVLVVLLSLAKTIYPDNNTLEGNRGYGLTWFIFLYIVAAYIRLYYEKVRINKKKSALVYVVTIIFQVYLFILCSVYELQKYVRQSFAYNSTILLVESISLFLFFKEVKINNTFMQKAILSISPLTLGVYLIHDNEFVSCFLWNKINIIEIFKQPTLQMLVLVIGISLCIFSICAIIEKTRKIIFNVLGKMQVIKFLEKKVEKLNESLNMIMLN